MGALIYNELRKLFFKKKTWIVAIIFVIMSGIFIYGENDYIKRKAQWNDPKNLLGEAKDRKTYTEKQIKLLGEKIIKANDKDKEALKLQLKTLNNELQVSNDEIISLENEIKNPLTEEQKLGKRIENIEKNMIGVSKNESYYYHLESEYKQLKYLKDHNIKIDGGGKLTAFGFFKSYIPGLGTLFLPLIIIALVGDIVAGECTPSTFKFLLIQPFSRKKVLLSKYITAIIASIAIVLSIEGAAFLLVGGVSGFGDSNYPVLTGSRYAVDSSAVVKAGEIAYKQVENSTEIITMGKYTLNTMGYNIIYIIACASVGFLISALVNSSMTAMITSILSTVVLFTIPQFSKSIMKMAIYLFTFHGNIEAILTGTIIPQTGNLSFTPFNGIIVLLLTSIICYMLSNIVFIRKDFKI